MLPGIFLLTVDKKGKPVVVPYVKKGTKIWDDMILSKKKRRLKI